MKRPIIPRGQRNKLREVNKIMRDSKFPIQYYILRDNGTIRKASVLHWGYWAEQGKHIICKTLLFDGLVKVSTIFLGFDHNHIGRIIRKKQSKPHFFETMIFGSTRLDEHQVRYSTYEDALLGHMAFTELAKSLGISSGDEKE